MNTTGMMGLRPLAVCGVLLVLAVAGACGSGEPSVGLPAPTQSSTPQPTGAPLDRNRDGGFSEADAMMARMVDTRAAWHAPREARVNSSLDIGLSIGDGKELRRQVEQALPDSPTQPGIPLKVGTDVSARLVGDPADVTVTPNDSIDASTGSDIALLWTWIVRPLRPTDSLLLTAYLSMTVPGTTHVLTKFVHVTLHITRTFGYTVNQVFTNWGTWAAIVTTLAAAARWAWRRRRIPRAPPGPPTAQAKAVPPDPNRAPRHVLKE